jgi:prepilin-type processing-associated H-X9-DG protein
VANLRTIGVAAQQFAAANNGRILTWDLYPLNRDGIDDRWFQGLASTIAGTNQEIQWNGPELNRIWSRLACPSVGEKYCSWSRATYAANSFQDPPWGHSLVLMQRIEKPSKTLYLVDGWVTFGAYPGVDLPDPGWPPPGNWPGGPPNGNIDRWIFFPHRGKCNGLFLDGHVESFSGRLPASAIRPP